MIITDPRAFLSTKLPSNGVHINEDGKKVIVALDVWFDNRRIGMLSIGEMNDKYIKDGGSTRRFVFRFDEDAVPEDWSFIGLKPGYMQYASQKLFPIFEQHLPEMKLAKFPAWKHTEFALDTMGVLAAAGNRSLAPYRLATPGMRPTDCIPITVTREAITEKGINGEEFFDTLVNRCTHIPGISGVQPKVLVDMSDLMPYDTDVRTMRTDTHILKIAHTERLRGITLMEHHALEAARRAGIPAASSFTSDDGLLLAVERFDVIYGDHDEILGKRLVQEFCGQLDKTRAQKYEGDLTEAMAPLLVSDDNSRTAANLLRFYEYVAFNYIIENGDAHLKNFALMRERVGDSPRLAPLYDIVTTSPFTTDIFGAQDYPALTLLGRRQWSDWNALYEFGHEHCGVSQVATLDTIDRIAAAVRAQLPVIRNIAENHATVGEAALRTFGVWERSTASALRWSAKKRPEVEAEMAAEKAAEESLAANMAGPR